LTIALAIVLGGCPGANLQSVTTYQGFLLDDDVPAEGVYNFQLSLYNAPSGGNQVGDSPQTFEGVTVTRGLFTLYPDFGINIPPSVTELYVEVAVQGSGDPAYVVLATRGRVTPAPAAIVSQHTLALATGQTIDHNVAGHLVTAKNSSIADDSGCIQVESTGASGATHAAVFAVASSDGTAVIVRSTAATGSARGMSVECQGVECTALDVRADSASGENYGIFVEAASADGTALVCRNAAGTAARFEGDLTLAPLAPAAPTIAFYDGTSTGLKFVRCATAECAAFDATPVTLKATAEDDMVVVDGSSVGIGTAAPTATLDVARPSASARVHSTAAGQDVSLDVGTSQYTFRLAVSDGTGGFSVRDVVVDRTPVTVKTGAADDMIVIDGGRVGIGTAAPDVTLDVARPSASARVHSTAAGQDVSLDVGTSQYTFRLAVSDGTGQFSVRDIVVDTTPFTVKSGAADDMIVIDGGRVGIGTAAPDVTLDVARPMASARVHSTAAGQDVSFDLGTSQYTFRLAVSDGSGAFSVRDMLLDTTPITVRPASANDMVVIDGTSVGIGTATPSATLDVAGTLQTAGFKLPGGLAGDVLTNDGTGNASWQASAGGSGGEWTDNPGSNTVCTTDPLRQVGVGTCTAAARMEVSGHDLNLHGTNAALAMSNTAPLGQTWNMAAQAQGNNGPAGGLSVWNANNNRYAVNLNVNGFVGLSDRTLPVHPVHVGTSPINGNGAFCSAGGNWTSTSDRETKQMFEPLDTQDILRRVVQLPVSRWQYKGEDAGVRHIGPVAQDFYASFQLGESERHIGMVDADGVALAAIQGLYDVVEEKDCRIEQLETRNHDLAERNAGLEARLAALEASVAALVGHETGGER
jgi:hypothetical protein